MTWTNKNRCRPCHAPKDHPAVACEVCGAPYAHAAFLRGHAPKEHGFRPRETALLVERACYLARGWPLPPLPPELRAAFARQPGVRLSAFRARPCGHTHAHLSDILRCIEKNGVPGFESLGPIRRAA